MPQMSELTGRNHRCRAQFKCVQTVVGQRFAGNAPNGLSYYYFISLRNLTQTIKILAFGSYCDLNADFIKITI